MSARVKGGARAHLNPSTVASGDVFATISLAAAVGGGGGGSSSGTDGAIASGSTSGASGRSGGSCGSTAMIGGRTAVNIFLLLSSSFCFVVLLSRAFVLLVHAVTR